MSDYLQQLAQQQQYYGGLGQSPWGQGGSGWTIDTGAFTGTLSCANPTSPEPKVKLNNNILLLEEDEP